MCVCIYRFLYTMQRDFNVVLVYYHGNGALPLFIVCNKILLYHLYYYQFFLISQLY